MRGRPIGKPCCGCSNNLNRPEVKFIACVAGRTIEYVCECRCHATPNPTEP